MFCSIRLDMLMLDRRCLHGSCDCRCPCSLLLCLCCIHMLSYQKPLTGQRHSSALLLIACAPNSRL